MISSSSTSNSRVLESGLVDGALVFEVTPDPDPSVMAHLAAITHRSRSAARIITAGTRPRATVIRMGSATVASRSGWRFAGGPRSAFVMRPGSAISHRTAVRPGTSWGFRWPPFCQ